MPIGYYCGLLFIADVTAVPYPIQGVIKTQQGDMATFDPLADNSRFVYARCVEKKKHTLPTLASG